MVIYSRSSCSPCLTVKAFLDRLGVAYEVKDVDDPNNQKEWLQYAMSVPVVVSGDQVVIGANLSRIKELLDT